MGGRKRFDLTDEEYKRAGDLLKRYRKENELPQWRAAAHFECQPIQISAIENYHKTVSSRITKNILDYLSSMYRDDLGDDLI